MGCRITDLRCKEVINIRDGARLGFVSDIEVDTTCGQVVAIVVPTGGFIFGGDDVVVPWCSIVKIGDDTILVDHECKPRPRRERKKFF